MNIRPVALCFGLAVMSGFAVTARATYNPAIVLPDAGGDEDSVVRAINSLGESVGWSATASGGFDAVLWSANGTGDTVLFDASGQNFSKARAINASGESVGWSVTATGVYDPVLWSSSGTTATVLGKGESLGVVKTTKGYDAILWHPKGGGTLLHDPGHEGVAQVFAINGTGHSAGYVDIAGGGTEAVLWGPKGGAKLLQDVGGQGKSEALAINATDYSVGWSMTATGQDAVRWSPLGTATLLNGLKGSTVSGAVAENNLGLSIGYSDTVKGDDAILWGPKGGIKAVLQDPGGQGVESALAMNDSGQSVGYADIAGGGTEAVLWQSSGKATNSRGATGVALEQYRSRGDQQSGRHYRVWPIPERSC